MYHIFCLLLLHLALISPGYQAQTPPASAADYLNRGIEREAKGDTKGAIAAYTKAIEIGPPSVEIYVRLGIARATDGNTDEAILDFTKAIEIDPGAAKAYVARAFARDFKGDKNGAISDFKKAIEIGLGTPELNAELHFGLAEALSDTGNYDGAIAAYTKSLELNPRMAEAYGSRGLVLLKLGKDAQAQADLDKCFELNSSLRPGYEQLADKVKQGRKK
jgi:tetratricopeptide (TPR) repeat protein